ncbi:MAG: hypothetical protein O3B72_07895 [Proteobacteria bacterium]|nr:hypothetical protein [Pseudomonadota bacterium]
MTTPLNRSDYDALLDDLQADRAQLQISRNVARRFFTHVSPGNIHSVTGQYVVIQHLLVIASLVAGVLCAAASLLVVYLEFDTMAFLAVPLTGILWTVIAGFSNELGGTWDTLSMYLVSLVLIWFLPTGYILPVFFFVTGLLLYRAAHLLAAYFLKKLVIGSFEAFEMLEQHITVVGHAD